MVELFLLILGVLASLFKSRARLEAENLVLRQQSQRTAPAGAEATAAQQYRPLSGGLVLSLCPSVFGAIAIVRPETMIRWHRARFRAYWRWRSRNRVGRPRISAELRKLIGEMSRANRLWGAPHT